MVDEIEFMHMDLDEDRQEHDVPVVIKFSEILGKWFICHRKSHQNAFRKSVNSFDTELEAVEFAEENYCIVFDL